MIRFGAMGRRIFAIVFAAVLVSSAIFGAVTLITLAQTERQYGRQQLETLVRQLRMSVESDYMQLLQLSQQMLPTGPVGQIMGEYLRAQDAYERGASKRRLTKALSTYSGLGTLLVMYYDAPTRSSIFSSFTPSEAFVRDEGQNAIYSGAMLTYQALHRSYTLISGRLVVSLWRDADFDEDRQYAIYVERTSDAQRIARDAASAQGVGYALVQLDDAGIVRYSSDPEAFAPQTVLELGAEPFGLYKQHYFVRERFAFGGSCVVLAAADAYSGATRSWSRRAIAAAIAALALVIGAALMLYRYVFRGLGVFKHEIDKTIGGDLESSPNLTGIDELDQLLHHFDSMKQTIKRVMREDAERTERMHQKEREMLIYQINPHFLFNTLNSLHWLAMMARQPAISRYVSNLSAILSYNLGRGQRQPTLRTELQMLELYLEIEQARHDFLVVREIPDGPHLDIRSPRLILQPIVENAIGHGMDVGGELTLRVGADGGWVRVEISDDGCGIEREVLEALMSDDDERAAQRGVGLRYVRAALDAQYGGRARFTIGPSDGGGTRVTLELPYDGAEVI